MSYTPVFGAKARPQWRALAPLLQELVLDELERVAAEAPSPSASELFRDIVHNDPAAGVRHYVFLRLLIRHRVRTITVTAVGHIQKAQKAE